MEYVIEPQKRVPVAHDVDVAVAGAGISGVFAALGAARLGARVALVDRFGSPGGNLGPGMIVGYTVERARPSYLHDGAYPGALGEFMDAFEHDLGDAPRMYSTISHAVSNAALRLFEKAGVQLILSAYAADPILEGGDVRGLFVETKSGRIAVRAKVVVDATGDADIASRAGAPVRKGVGVEEVEAPNLQAAYKDKRYRTWNDGQIWFLLGGADIEKYQAFRKQPCALTPEQKRWADDVMRIGQRWPDSLVPVLMEGWESGEFRMYQVPREGVYVAFNDWFHPVSPGLGGGRAGIFGDYDTGDWADVAAMEAAVRRIAFEGVNFFRRKRVPGLENAFILATSAFLGARGGPFIDAEHVLTPQETYAGLRAPDVMYVSYVEVHRGADAGGHDMPYRMLLPKKVDGLLVTGRGAGFLRRGHDPSTRERSNMMALGQATGMAAALAAADGVAPRRLDVRKLQRALLAEAFYLGDRQRLLELGLAD